ncbi:EAL domain-containing protein (putative c-di-GMP-specific phosphodiesterase class I) [Paucimonas lemoignei]|uniref:EAL domain-containing protein (Putative c-di-GMP-specific phosphodiesterase class I) n=1 Tax=Paucimonas lemoignei TaxID=29443 RepID=A0A4R3HTX9_PAULE|nr:EAL domain-containing protein [Paucimonas lemoignei]TCS36657.1 EAL domain-containing protein (putative c-di-GMP-specific phosphodiesterase class I) [Paucimonas lemoignei]
MSFPVLEDYLGRLRRSTGMPSSVWIDSEGRAQGRYFNCTLTSAFQPIRQLGTDRVAGFEAFARSYSEQGSGLAIWKLLDHVANDDESVELDRLCRMLHAINFYRQAGTDTADLFLSVHDRLLAAVSGNHGVAFRRILAGLGLPISHIVLQLPPITPNQGWLLNYVANNYQLNGFRIAINAAHAKEALHLLTQVHPAAVKIDAREISDLAAVRELLDAACARDIQVIFKRVESQAVLNSLQELSSETGRKILVQGYHLDSPAPTLHSHEEIQVGDAIN